MSLYGWAHSRPCPCPHSCPGAPSRSVTALDVQVRVLHKTLFVYINGLWSADNQGSALSGGKSGPPDKLLLLNAPQFLKFIELYKNETQRQPITIFGRDPRQNL